MARKKKQNTGLLFAVIALCLLLAALVIVPAFLSGGEQDTPTEPAAQTTAASSTEAPTTDATEAPTMEATQATAATAPTEPRLQENPYTPEDFGYEGGFMTCFAAQSLLGIDVSAYQTDIDWQAVKDAGIEFVIIRAGFRGYGQTGSLNTDKLAQSHYEGAKAAGLKVGAYFFSQAISEEEARDEAAYLLEIIQDWELDMPVAYDWEYISDTARTADTGAETVTACAIAFCEAVKTAGYTPMVYVSQSQTLLQLEKLAAYDLWAAHYSDEMTYPHLVDIWQYTSTGTVPGISGNADIDLWILS